MASENTYREASVDFSDRGYGSISKSSTPSSVDPKYACYWLEKCNGNHEQMNCYSWKAELTGKLGIYYSPTGFFRNFQVDQINGKSLAKNPTGTVLISLLIHQRKNDQVFILFITKLCRSKGKKGDYGRQQLQLSLPSSKRFIKGESCESVAERAMLEITNSKECIDHMLSSLKRFLFVNANVVYPVKLNSEKADLLDRNLTLDSDVKSVHWIPLQEVSRNIRSTPTRIRPTNIDDELSQTSVNNAPDLGTSLTVDDNEMKLDPLAGCLLALILGVVGFDEFLEIAT